MSNTSLVLGLEGDISLSQFAAAVSHFHNLVIYLSDDVAGDTQIIWDVEDLQVGSAIISVAGRADAEEPILQVVSAFELVGQALQESQPIPFSKAVAKEAKAITELIDQGMKAIRFGTARMEAIILTVWMMRENINTKPMIAFGTVKGRVQSISNRGKSRFTLYDSVFDKPVSCYINDDQNAIFADIWDKNVVVTGQITRQPDSGQPVSVRDISNIDVVPSIVAGSYRQARGILAGIDDPLEPADVSIRRLRDANN
jgi:hypothetical protein